MTDKFELYDVLAILVPGILVTYICVFCFPNVLSLVPKMGDTLNALAFTALGILIGQIVQALSSSLEPLLFKSWGGKPSTLALTNGLGERYWSAAEAKRVRAKLTSNLGADASTEALFRLAMQLAEKKGSIRATKFNALYAYHRALIVLSLIALFVTEASAFVGTLSTRPKSTLVLLVIPVTAMFLLFWNRCRQRAFYYVREILQVAENAVDDAKVTASAKP